MKKTFCDLCGEPAIGNAYSSFVMKSMSTMSGNINRFFIQAEATEGKDYHPKLSDPRMDICMKCFIAGIKNLVKHLEDKQEEVVAK